VSSLLAIVARVKPEPPTAARSRMEMGNVIITVHGLVRHAFLLTSHADLAKAMTPPNRERIQAKATHVRVLALRKRSLCPFVTAADRAA